MEQELWRLAEMNPYSSNVGVRGNLTLVLYGADGEVKDVRHARNLVVDTGLEHIADMMASSHTDSEMGYMALGSDGTGALAGNTALGTQLGSRNALTARTHSGAVVTYTATFSAGQATGAVVEAGIFEDAAGGTMLCRTTFTVINKGAADSLAVTWTLTFTDDGV